MDITPLSPVIINGYGKVTFRRSLSCLVIAFGAFMLIVFVQFNGDIGVGPPLAVIALWSIIALALIFGIRDAFFVLEYKYFRKNVAYGGKNLYITRRRRQTTIPLADITSIRLTPSGMNRTTRGRCSVYLIDYNLDGRKKQVEIEVYPSRSGAEFARFSALVQQSNPSAEISAST